MEYYSRERRKEPYNGGENLPDNNQGKEPYGGGENLPELIMTWSRLAMLMCPCIITWIETIVKVPQIEI